jgi:transcriptional regulator with XRE-family HTH domain
MAGTRKQQAGAELKAYGERIRQLREARGLSQEQLAHLAGLSRPVVGFIERAERDTGVSHVWALATALHVQPHELFLDVTDST